MHMPIVHMFACLHRVDKMARGSLLVAGNSVCAFLYGFEPYFYIMAPNNCTPDDCDSLRRNLNVSAPLCARNQSRDKAGCASTMKLERMSG